MLEGLFVPLLEDLIFSIEETDVESILTQRIREGIHQASTGTMSRGAITDSEGIIVVGLGYFDHANLWSHGHTGEFHVHRLRWWLQFIGVIVRINV